jgi:proline iminopeptidase
MTSHNAQPAHVRPFDAIQLSVGDGHWLYVEEVGTRAGVPVIFLHGGPGSGAQHGHRTLFDASRYHAILFDQRGAGRSHPYLSTEANTTAHLVADIEAIREHFGIERWFVVGGSWGSTLALRYAQTHPKRVCGMVLRAIFLGTRAEIDWAFVEGPRRFRPELHEAFVNWLPEHERTDPVAAYVARLTHPDLSVRAAAAHIWNAYERALSELTPSDPVLPMDGRHSERLPPTPIMEAHYIANDFFMPDGALLEDAHRLAGIPGVLVQGRYDLLCPPVAAHAIARAWPGVELNIVDAAGHAMTEPGVMAAMREALDRLAFGAR